MNRQSRFRPNGEYSPNALLTAKQAAKYMNTGERRVRGWMEEMKLKYVILDPASRVIVKYTIPRYIAEFLDSLEVTEPFANECQRKAEEFIGRMDAK